MTQEQKEWLMANKRQHNEETYDEWVYTSNARPMIDELVEQGTLRPAGKFVMAPQADPPETVNLFGKIVPIETMVSIYTLNRGVELS